jgi:hypothetical protein
VIVHRDGSFCNPETIKRVVYSMMYNILYEPLTSQSFVPVTPVTVRAFHVIDMVNLLIVLFNTVFLSVIARTSILFTEKSRRIR